MAAEAAPQKPDPRETVLTLRKPEGAAGRFRSVQRGATSTCSEYRAGDRPVTRDFTLDNPWPNERSLRLAPPPGGGRRLAGCVSGAELDPVSDEGSHSERNREPDEERDGDEGGPVHVLTIGRIGAGH